MTRGLNFAIGPMVFFSALLTIMAAPWALDLPQMAWIFKPLATTLIIVYALGRGTSTPTARTLVVVGLVLSLAGDVALLWPEMGFLPGLGFFLFAHVAYFFAFFGQTRRFVVWWGLYLAVAAVVLFLLWPRLPGFVRWPVVAYAFCLTTMAAQAAAVWRGAIGSDGEGRARTLAIGGLLFVVSDAVLATNRFALRLPLSDLWILSTYWAAQWCTASWLPPSRRRISRGSPGGLMAKDY